MEASTSSGLRPTRTAPWDTVLTLRIDALDTLAARSHSAAVSYQAAVIDLGKITRRRMLIHIPSTDLWRSLLRRRQASFDTVQTFLSELYVLASSALDEDVGVDVVLGVLREDDDAANRNTDDISPAIRYIHPSHRRDVDDNAKVDGKPDEDAPAGSLGRLGKPETPVVSQEQQEEAEEQQQQLGTVALGGTFDHLHPGHQILLTMACWLATRRVIVGITDDVLLKGKSDRDLLESLDDRTRAVRNFLGLICPSIQHDTPALQDVYGPTASDPDVQGILVSEETRKGASAIADVRSERGLSSLKLFVIKVIAPQKVLDGATTSREDMVKAKIGSTAIRARIRARQTQAQSAQKASW